MLNLGKISVVLEKSVAIMGLGLVAAACGFFLLKTGLEKFILGGGQFDRWARFKGLIIMALACALLAAGIVTILEAELVLKLLSKEVRDWLEIPLA